MKRDYIARVLAKARKELSYTLSGNMLSKVKGEGFDFAELNPYIEGMDSRKIYWNSLAKGGALQYKTFFEEKEIYVVTALLLDGSLVFGEPVQKREKALESAAVIGYMTTSGGHIFSGFTFSQKGREILPPTKAPHAMEGFIYRTGAIDPLYTKLDYDMALERLFRSVKRRSLIFLIGDFLEIPNLGKLSKKHLVHAVIVRDRFEAHPKALGESLLVDPQSGAEAELFFDEKTARHYAQKYREHDAKLHAAFHKAGVHWQYLYTDENAATLLR